MSSRVPRVVATQSFLALSSDTGTVDVFTPEADGLFRVSLAVDMPSTTTGSIEPIVGFTDSLNTAQLIAPTTGASPGQAGSATAVIFAKTTAPITFRAVPLSGASGVDVFVVIEEL